jgi:uroporphyrin-III C-methyltransferase / precorrin-2 dehydrogenase / sirohydrochlorin ferrochelatase
VALPSLPLFHQLDGQPVILLGEGEAADAKRRLLERAGAIVSDDPALRGARLAFVALDGPDADHAAALLRARGLLVNVVDRPELCDFTTPAIIDRAPVIIAIGTGGASAGLAKALRQRLETMLPATLGRLADALFAARPGLRTRWPLGADRRRAIDAALMPGAPLDPFADGAAARVAGWLAADADAHVSGVLHHIMLTSADPDDLTLRQARWLASADHLCHTNAVPTAILDRARADATRTFCAAAPPAPGSGVTVWLDIAQ